MSVSNLRPHLAHHLQQRFLAFSEGFRHNLALIGPAGSGKTFQLQQLLAHPHASLLPIYCPMYKESCRSFLQRLQYAILTAGQGPAAVQSEPALAALAQPEPLEHLLQRAEATMPKTAAQLRHVGPLLARRIYGEAFTRTLDAIPLLREERQQSCVLILDEFLYLEELGLGHAFHEVGKRVMTWPSVLFVLTSSNTYRARLILRERLQLLFGQFELVTLGPLDLAVTSSWVQRELSGLAAAAPLTVFLTEWLRNSPWQLSIFLKRMKELATLYGVSTLNEELVLATAWDVLGQTEGTLHQWCASHITRVALVRGGTKAVEALIRIAQGTRTATELGHQVGRGGLTAALQLLLEHDLAERNGSCWTVPDPVLRCWLSTVLVSERADTQPGTADVRERFDQYLRARWRDWMSAQALSFSDQVVALFGRFADDTVSLDSKIGRLPKFDRIALQAPTPGAPAYVVAEAQGKRWCATVREHALTEADIASFDVFCRKQAPKPSRKVVIARQGLDENARLLAKTANMWVWEAADLQRLMGLYGH